MIRIITADITTLDVDAIVNAANESLLGGGGVDGAIHAVAGAELLVACREIGGCPTGESRLTRGYALPARHVIHTVGPVWHGGEQDEPALLRSCYVTALSLARENDLTSIAFPAISTGVFGYPKDAAAAIACDVARRWLEEARPPREITFCCFSDADRQIYERVAGA